MKISNETKDKLIASDAKEPSSLLAKSVGLIGAKKPATLILKTHFGIHTFGVRFPIDVLILDEENRVVAMKEKLRPFGFFVWNLKYETVIELAAGTIAKTKTSLGDKLTIHA